MLDFKMIGLRIKEKRFEEQITQAYLAEKAELSAQYLSQIELGKKRISLQALFDVARALHTTVDELLIGNFFDEDEVYVREISDLLADCSGIERKMLYEMMIALKKTLHENLVYMEKQTKK